MVQEWDPDALHALVMFFLEPSMAADYGLIYYICGEDAGVTGIPMPWPCPNVGPTLPCLGAVLTGTTQLGLQLIHLLCGQAAAASEGSVGLCDWSCVRGIVLR